MIVNKTRQDNGDSAHSAAASTRLTSLHNPAVYITYEPAQAVLSYAALTGLLITVRQAAAKVPCKMSTVQPRFVSPSGE
jgi:hypothetical protein